MYALISCERPGRIPARLPGSRLAGRIGQLAVVELPSAQLRALRELMDKFGGELHSAWERSQAFVESPRARRVRREDRRQASRRARRVSFPRKFGEEGQSITAYAVILLLVIVVVIVMLSLIGAGSGPEVGEASSNWGVVPRLLEFAKQFPLK